MLCRDSQDTGAIVALLPIALRFGFLVCSEAHAGLFVFAHPFDVSRPVYADCVSRSSADFDFDVLCITD